MNPTLLILLAPMLAVALFCRWRWPHTITWLEAGAQALIGVVIVGCVWGASVYSLTADTETLNGQVTGKQQTRVPCSHSYSCHCRTVSSGSGKNHTTRTVCDTCYEHSNDWDWDVSTTVGGFTVDRVDRRGSDEPARWTAVQVGQPVALPHSYTNYVKGAPDSLFHIIADFKGRLPEYPGFYDYQFQNRVLGAPQRGDEWNSKLAYSLRELGPRKQVNYLVVMTSQSPRFADALRSKWLGGKKNDIVVVIGTRYPQIQWVRVFSWAKHDIVNVALRNALLDSKTLNPDKTIGIIADHAERLYVRRPMSDFEYLKDDVHPSTWVMVLALILGALASIGAAIFFHGNDCYDQAHRPRDLRRTGADRSVNLRRPRFR